jgi:flavin reductase (DIM6/NTAB) family NADH-FMN oxidoreductase RutF
MQRRKISNQSFPYPMPMVVVSSVVDDRVNHMAVGWVTRANGSPPMLTVTINKGHHTTRGIVEHRAFGVSVPPIEAVAAVDYVGIDSGDSVDKSGIFDLFYGSLEHAPLIATFPLCMACRLNLFVGEIVEAWVDEACVTNDKPDPEKMRLFCLTMPDNRYWSLGPYVAKAWGAGKGFTPPA